MEEEEREGAKEVIAHLTKKNKETILLTQEYNKKDKKWKKIFSLVYQKNSIKTGLEWMKERQKKSEIALFTNHTEKYLIDKEKTVLFSFCKPHQVMQQNADILFLNANFWELKDILAIAQHTKRKITFSQYAILGLFFVNIFWTIAADFSVLPSLFFIGISYFSAWIISLNLVKKWF